MTYHHLNHQDRDQLLALLKARLTQSQISAILGWHKSTISRDINGNQDLLGDRHKQACRRYLVRLKFNTHISSLSVDRKRKLANDQGVACTSLSTRILFLDYCATADLQFREVFVKRLFCNVLFETR